MPRYELDHMAELNKIVKGQLVENEPMALHSSYGVGGPAKAYITPKNVNDLSRILQYAHSHGIKTFFVGSGSNILVSDTGIDGLVISPAKALTDLSINDGKINAESGVMLGRLVRESIKRNLTGFEGLGGVPGTLGGAIMMNAGAFGHEISNSLVSVTVMQMDGTINTLLKNDITFLYRYSSIDSKSFIVSALFDLEKSDFINIQNKRKKASEIRKSSQPLKYRSAGSVFKNPKPPVAAGYLIDQAGLKGLRQGDAEISEKHANFFINHGKATATDISTLIQIARKEVKEKFNIMLELEIKTFGFDENELLPNG